VIDPEEEIETRFSGQSSLEKEKRIIAIQCVDRKVLPKEVKAVQVQWDSIIELF